MRTDFLNFCIDYGIFAAYAVIFWQLLSTWWQMRRLHSRNEHLLSILLMGMIASVLIFVAGNAYMLNTSGHTLLNLRIFQVFVMANFFVYWLTLTLIRKGGSLYGQRDST